MAQDAVEETPCIFRRPEAPIASVRSGSSRSQITVGGFPSTAKLDKDIEHITILIYRAPEALVFALYLYEDLVQVPRVAETTLSTLQSPSVFRLELGAPKSDRFVREP